MLVYSKIMTVKKTKSKSRVRHFPILSILVDFLEHRSSSRIFEPNLLEILWGFFSTLFLSILKHLSEPEGQKK
jgi:hypothetical protein